MSETSYQKKQQHLGIVLWVLAFIIAVTVSVFIQREQTRVDKARRQEVILRDSLIQADVAAIIIDETQKMVFVTPAVYQLTGYTPHELSNRPLETVIPVAYRETHNEARARASAQPDAFSGKHQIYCQVRRKDGKNVPVMVNIIGSYAKGGMAILSPASMTEIQSKLHDMALEAAAVGVWWWEIDQDRLVWDTRMYEIYGRHEKDGWTPTFEGFNACVHPEDREWLNRLISQCIARKSYYRAVFRAVRPDGQVIYVRAYGQIFEAGTLRIFAGVNIEVSADEYDGGATWELGELGAENPALRSL